MTIHCNCQMYLDIWSSIYYVGFEVLTAVIMKSAIFWDITPCSPLSVNRCFRGTSRLHLRGREISWARKSVKAGGKQLENEKPIKILCKNHVLCFWFEALMAVTMKNIVFGLQRNTVWRGARHFGRTYHLHLHSQRVSQAWSQQRQEASSKLHSVTTQKVVLFVLSYIVIFFNLLLTPNLTTLH
jgi:hypothetical protein